MKQTLPRCSARRYFDGLVECDLNAAGKMTNRNCRRVPHPQGLEVPQKQRATERTALESSNTPKNQARNGSSCGHASPRRRTRSRTGAAPRPTTRRRRTAAGGRAPLLLDLDRSWRLQTRVRCECLRTSRYGGAYPWDLTTDYGPVGNGGEGRVPDRYGERSYLTRLESVGDDPAGPCAPCVSLSHALCFHADETTSCLERIISYTLTPSAFTQMKRITHFCVVHRLPWRRVISLESSSRVSFEFCSQAFLPPSYFAFSSEVRGEGDHFHGVPRGSEAAPADR